MKPKEIYLIDQLNSSASFLFKTAKRFMNLGYLEMQNGTKLYGPVPHIAPYAWCHAFPPCLSDGALLELSKEVESIVPSEYLDFLKEINGAHLFCGEFALYGIRPIAAGRSLDSAFLPFDLIDANKIERSRKLPRELFVIGGYSYDGSKIVLNTTKNTVERWSESGDACLNIWQSFTLFIQMEITRLDKLFDDKGKYLSQREEDIVPSPVN